MIPVHVEAVKNIKNAAEEIFNMNIYLIIMGIFCMLYYTVIAVYSHRLRSTFALFWAICGGVHLILGCAPLPAYTYRFLAVAVPVGWAAICFLEFNILRAMYSRCSENADWMIILGAQVRGTRITDSLKRRLDAAVQYLESFPEIRIVVSGGQGPGEDISEAEAMMNYLIENGIKRERIFCESFSTSTSENLNFSKKYLDTENEKIIIVTNNFHIYRASLIAKREGYKKILLLPASSNRVFQLNYLARELFAVLFFYLFDRKKKESEN